MPGRRGEEELVPGGKSGEEQVPGRWWEKSSYLVKGGKSVMQGSMINGRRNSNKKKRHTLVKGASNKRKVNFLIKESN